MDVKPQKHVESTVYGSRVKIPGNYQREMSEKINPGLLHWEESKCPDV